MFDVIKCYRERAIRREARKKLPLLICSMATSEIAFECKHGIDGMLNEFAGESFIKPANESLLHPRAMFV
jgi:hypothetical protein